MSASANNNQFNKRSPITPSSSFAIRWVVQLVVTALMISATLINQTYGFKPINGESRKLFGGYRITPKQCRATKTLPSTDPRAKGPTICMFNHECAQRNGEVVGACMDGFLFGACCQVPSNQMPEHTLINDAQNAYFHQYQNQKLQQQESETNKIVSQAYETFAENSAQQQSLDASQTHDTGYGGGAISNLYHANDAVGGGKKPQSDSIKASTSSPVASTASTASSAIMETNSVTQASPEPQTNKPRVPPKINVNRDSVKVSSPSQSPQSDDFVQQVLNTLPPGEGNKATTFTTEVPTKIADTLAEQSSSESNSFEEEPVATTRKPILKKPESEQQTEIIQEQYTQSAPQQQAQTVQHQYLEDEPYTESLQHDTDTEADDLFGGVSFTHSDITHPGADADLIEDDLQFSTGYGPQPVFLPAPSKINNAHGHDPSKHTSTTHDATTSSSSITTHVDSIETIIQQLNNNNSSPGPTYNIISPQEQQHPHQHQHQYDSPSYYNDPLDITKRPVPEEEQTKHTSLGSLSHNDKHNAANLQGQASSLTSSSSLSSDDVATATTNAVYADPVALEDHTLPDISNNDFHTSNHQTSGDFDKVPAVGIAYPVDMSYMEEEDNLHTDQHLNSPASYAEQQQHDTKVSYSDNKQQQQQQILQDSFTSPQQLDTKVSHFDNQHQQQQLDTKISQLGNKQQQQQSMQDTNLNNKQQLQLQQQQQQGHDQVSHLNTYSTQSDEGNFPQAQTIHNYVAETHQRPIASYIGVVTSQNYNPRPLPNEVVVSSHTTKVEEDTEVATEYKPIITTNQIITTSHKTTTTPVKHLSPGTTSHTKRPTLVTKKPNTRKPTKASNKYATTNSYASTSSISTQQQQQHYPSTPLETKAPSSPQPLYSKPTASYTQGHQQQNYIISSGSTPKPLVTRKPTQKQNAKPASTSYITGPTTPRPAVTSLLQNDQVETIQQADDKLDSFLHSTAQSLASATPSQESLSYDPPVFISAGAQVQNQRPQYNVHKKPGFVKVQSTQRPPAPTVLITPKPTSLLTTASSLTTSGYGSTSFLYNSLITRRPDFMESTAAGADYMSISTVNSNDFDDPGYYGSADHTKPARPAFISAANDVIYPVPTDDKPAFPGYYGPTPTYPAFQIPGEKLESPIEEEVYTSPNDFINFPPVRNPNLNMSATSSAVTNDFALSTPAFVEDTVLKNKMNTLVHKIVESLQGNFEALANLIDENNNTASVQTYQASPLDAAPSTRKPTRKSATKATTPPKTKATTKKPNTRVPTKAPAKKPGTTRRPESTTKRQVVRRTTTTTKRPATRKPTRKATTTTTRAPIEDDLVDEEDEDDVNPSDNEIVEEDSYGSSGSGRKIQCGMRPHIKSGRIVGGKGAAFGAYPWQVLVRESTWLGLFTKNKCGGVLITNRYVITAAHCQPGFLASLVAVMGEFDISGDLESKPAVTKNVKRVIVHRQYNPATFENDIALLELDSPVTFDTHIVPICMPADGADFTGRMATATGWGRLKYGGGVPSVLQEVQVPIIENSVCQEMFHAGRNDKKILNSFLCAGYANGQKDSCEGDSGGPLVLQRADGRYELAGTVSHGIKCAAPFLPGVYMRTTFYKPWLKSITGVK